MLEGQVKVEEGRREHEEEGQQNRRRADRGPVRSAAHVGSHAHTLTGEVAGTEQKYFPALTFQESLELKKLKERMKVSVLRCNMSTANSQELTRGEGSECGKPAEPGAALRCSSLSRQCWVTHCASSRAGFANVMTVMHINLEEHA